jgi:hypothetical protein
MPEKRALVALGLAAIAAEIVAINGLALLGADSEVQAKVCVLLMSAASLAGGLLFMRYH